MRGPPTKSPTLTAESGLYDGHIHPTRKKKPILLRPAEQKRQAFSRLSATEPPGPESLIHQEESNILLVLPSAPLTWQGMRRWK